MSSADYSAYGKEFIQRERVLVQEMEAAAKKYKSREEKRECREAYYILIRQLDDEVRQKHGLKPLVWSKA
jgi:hypothetical protein